MRQIILAALVVLFASAVLAADTRHAELFRLTLDSPPNFPTCPMMRVIDGHPSLDRYHIRTSCLFLDTTRAFGPEGAANYQLHFAPGDRPNWIDQEVPFVLLGVRDRLVKSIFIATNGVTSQEDIFRQLTAKFGKPRAVKTTTLQNLVGARFDAIQAEWRVGTDIVWFAGAVDNFTKGTVNAYTADEWSRVRAREASAPHL